MQLSKSLELIYSKCSERIKAKINKSGMSLSEIYSADPKILSSIMNNKRTKNNPYLVPDRVFENNAAEDGLLLKAGFKSKTEVLWGSAEEIEGYISELFALLIEDLDKEDNVADFCIEEILLDFIPYSKSKTYFDLLFSKENTIPALLFGIREDSITDSIDTDRANAIKYIINKTKDDFLENFKQFAKETGSFKKLNKVFMQKFVVDLIIPMLKEIIGPESLGLRVRDMIIADLSQVPYVGSMNEEETAYYRSLINASSVYFLKLEKIQQRHYNFLTTK